jgi:hypothetical protein
MLLLKRACALSLALVLSPTVASASPADSSSWTVWSAGQIVMTWPTGEFHPPSSEGALGYELHATFVPPHRPVGLRVEIGTTEQFSVVGNVRVDNPNGLWVDNLSPHTGSRLSWAMVGAQWDPRASESGILLFVVAGAERVSPMEKLGDGDPVIEADVPGLPPSSTGFAWSAGVGSRLRVPGHENLAITGEFDYRHLGKATYVAAPGVQGDYPNTEFVVAVGPIETWTARVGLAMKWAPRP